MIKVNFDIYKLALHETTILDGPPAVTMSVTRVASGWIYKFMTGEIVFVPFDNRFQYEG